MAMMVSVRYHVYASNARADFAEETVRADEGLMNKDCITVSIYSSLEMYFSYDEGARPELYYLREMFNS